jgi:hypothetical protein
VILIRPAAFFLAILTVALAVSAQEGNAQEPPPFRSLRFEEDYGYLRDPARRTNPLDPLERIQLGPKPEIWLSLGGEARWRYENLRNRPQPRLDAFTSRPVELRRDRALDDRSNTDQAFWGAYGTGRCPGSVARSGATCTTSALSARALPSGRAPAPSAPTPSGDGFSAPRAAGTGTWRQRVAVRLSVPGGGPHPGLDGRLGPGLHL